MRHLILIVTLLSLLTDARADIQVVWIPVDGTEVDDPVYELKSDGDRLYGAAERGVIVSDDSGATWRTTLFERGVSALTVHGNTIYVGLNRDAGMFRSDDRGETWKPINHSLHLIEDPDARARRLSAGRTYYGWIKQILVTRSGSVITVMHGPIFISRDRGETWQDVSRKWYVPVDGAADYYLVYNEAKLLEFDGYLWAAVEDTIVRSPDNGRTWEFVLPRRSLRSPSAWLLHNHRIYVAAEWFSGDTAYFARYENGLSHPLVRGLPPHPIDNRTSHWDYIIDALVVHDGIIFAAIRRRGVYVFNERTESWSYLGLNGADVFSLVTHQSDLYAATDEGIYRAAIRTVIPHGKAVSTWGAIKQK